MLGQDGEARKGVLSSAEAQQGESCCNTAMHNIKHALCPVLLNSFVLFSQEEEEEEGGKKSKLEKLLAYHQGMVVEKGLPPSLLMEEHGATLSAPSAQSAGTKKLKCEQCDFNSDSQRGLKVHIGRSHKNPEVL